MFGENGRFVTLVLLLTFLCDRTSSECTQLTPCSCILPDGQGYDLSQLDNSSNLTASKDNLTLYFHPCRNYLFDLGNGTECSKGVSLCSVKILSQYNKDIVSRGTVEQTKVVDVSKEPALVLHHGENVTTITLICCVSCKTHLSIDSTDDFKNYHLSLVSPSACKVLLHAKGLSTGSLLLIYFFVFIGIYFIGGAIALKLLRGATGWEMIPNHQFWGDLPSLVRDGITFTFNCCHVDSYDRI